MEYKTKLPAVIPGTAFCQYATCKCPETLPTPNQNKVLFLYSISEPIIASTIEEAAEILKKKNSDCEFTTWKDIRNEGKIIFCQICKSIVASSLFVCDITTLNFNVMFEIGYLTGLSKSFIPIFDTSFGSKKNLITEIGLLDTIGYRPFLKAQDIVSIVETYTPTPSISQTSQVNRFQPIYYVKGAFDTEGSARLSSCLKKSAFRFRTFDPSEQSRLSILSAKKMIDQSMAVIVHLQQRDRGEKAIVNNARCAFVAGLAVATQKKVLILQEGTESDLPIDYRDLIRSYTDFQFISFVMEDFLKEVALTLQSPVESVAITKRSELEKYDIGDIAAENEIENLKSYYVRTGQYNDVRQGHAQLVVGRKGSGKTALFYALRNHIGPGRNDTLVLDLKPEGYQFEKLNEMILAKLTPAVRQHTVTALWDYILLLELAHKVIRDKKENIWAGRDNSRKNKLESIKNEYLLHRNFEEGDFSERLNSLIDEIIKREPNVDLSKGTPSVTQLIFLKDISNLRAVLVDYLSDKDEVWVIIDNLDKNWKINTSDRYEIMILRCLLDANRKLQKMLLKEEVNFHSVIFIRNDIYSFFLEQSSDRGKDQVVHLNWDDQDLFKEIFRLRASTDNQANADDVWAKIFDLQVNAVSSFRYMIERTLMRPRDFLTFIQHAIRTAINRGHNRVLADDILHAEKIYSQDLFQSLSYEISDVCPALENILYNFLESKQEIFESDLIELLKNGGITEDLMQEAIDTLIWFCFLGVYTSDGSERYAYAENYDIRKLYKLSEWKSGDISDRAFVIHPGFRNVLELKN